MVWHITFRLARWLKVDTGKPLKGLREIWFAAAFVCIGLETRLCALFKLGGGRAALAFLGGQGCNLLWTLLLARWLFGGK